jgi:ATP-dependent helicase HrpB
MHPCVKLPIDDLLPDILNALREGTSLVLEAPPGAGKTTRVPLAIVGENWMAGRRLVLLEPRRLAARAAATFMASSLGESVGQTVGYRMRMDTRVSRDTRIEVVTEGVLTRLLQNDPSLAGIGAVVFDEFHERSLHADLGLALCLEARGVLRPDLRIVVMSATLDGGGVARLLGDSPVVRSHGRLHAVETIHITRDLTTRIEDATARAVRTALSAHEGDVLVFLPGAGEIHGTARRLDDVAADVVPLFGNLSIEDQRRAIEPSPPGRRKVVLATSIAETSLTIEGVRIVIDSGLMRVPRFSARTGMTRLETLRVTRDSADQRRGRAGRTAPGICYRLWSEGDDSGLVARRTPEILEADLAPLALELAAWGVTDPASLRWLDSPPDAAFRQARELLAGLGALDAHGRINDHGRVLAGMPAHPRLAHMVVKAGELGRTALACDIAALVDERDPVRSDDGHADPDLRLRLTLLHQAVRDGVRAVPELHGGSHIDRGALSRVTAAARDWRRRLGPHDAGADSLDAADAGLLLAFAWPDRIAQRRADSRGRFLLRNGAGAAIPAEHPLAGEDFIVAASLGGRGRDSVVFLAAPISRSDLDRHFASHIETKVDVEWSPSTRSVRATRRTVLGAIILTEAPVQDAPRERVVDTIIAGIRADGIEALPWSDSARSVLDRMRFLHSTVDGWPDVSADALLHSLEEWLGPFLGAAGAMGLDRIDPGQLLLARLDHRQRARFDELAPTHFEVPSGSRIRLDYSDPASPALPVRLQEVFGLLETPRLAGGTVPVTMNLLSPAMRTVQVTRDLASFWRNGYFDVRKDLRGRYPKHHWPENPLEAQATRRTKRR